MPPTTLLALASLLPDATRITRRSAICGAATTALPLPALAANDAIEANQLAIARRRYALGRPYSPKLSPDELEGLELLSRYADRATQNDLSYIDLMLGNGDTPADGALVYVHLKYWTGGWDRGQPVDSTYFATVPVGFTLGSSNPFFAGLDAGVRTMKEGGWRRLVVPAALAFGDAGLKPAATASRKAVPPGASLFVDVRLLDAGSGRCDDLIRVKGVKSAMCEAADVPMKRTPVTLPNFG